MKRIPHIDSVINLIHEKTAAAREDTPVPQEKVASVNYTVPIANELNKVAQKLRDHDPTAITYADVHKFAEQLMGVSQ